MLKNVNYKNNENSVFICDRCGKNISWDDKYSIIVGVQRRTPVKKWDLCNKCYFLINHVVHNLTNAELNKLNNKKGEIKNENK